MDGPPPHHGMGLPYHPPHQGSGAPMSNMPPPNFQMGGPPSRHPAPGRKTLLNTLGMPPQHPSSGPGGCPVPGRHFDGPGQSHRGPPPSQRDPHYRSHPDQFGAPPRPQGDEGRDSYHSRDSYGEGPPPPPPGRGGGSYSGSRELLNCAIDRHLFR